MMIKMIGFTIMIGVGSCLAAYFLGEQTVQGFWAMLGNIGTVLGIISFVPIIYALWEYVQYTHREEEERKRIHTQVGTQPAILIVDVGGAGIRNEVEAFLKEEKGFENFDFDTQVFVVHRYEQQITASDVDSIIQDVEDQLNTIRIKAADKVHLFLKAPMPIVVMVGEVLANRIPTLVYHKQRNKGYENWGALHR